MRRAEIAVATDCTPPMTGPNACSTSWQSASGGYDATDHFNAPCAPESSSHVLRGTKRLRSVYGSCPFIITGQDVPADNLGSVSNMRDIIAASKFMGVGDQNTFSASLAAIVTYTVAGPAFRTAVGIWVAINFGMFLSQPETVSIATTGFVAAIGNDLATAHAVGEIIPVNRSVQLTTLEGCQVQKFFLPFAAPQVTSTLWGPVGAAFTAGATVVVEGAPAATSGNITVSVVGPYSSYLPEISGAVHNS